MRPYRENPSSTPATWYYLAADETVFPRRQSKSLPTSNWLGGSSKLSAWRPPAAQYAFPAARKESRILFPQESPIRSLARRGSLLLFPRRSALFLRLQRQSRPAICT